MEDIRITVILVLSLVAGSQAARCRPCDGSSSIYADKMNTCNHHVTKESVLNSLKSLNETFRSFKREMETQYNIIQGFDISSYSTPCVEDPLTDTIKKHLPNNHKDRFIHETYATLSYAYDVLKKASYNFKGEHWTLKSKLTKVMCKMVSVNRKIHCRKNSHKPSQQMKSFDVTKVCERRNVFPCGDQPIWTLKALGNVQTIIEYTLGFWDSCVKDSSRNGKLVVRKQKCKGSKLGGNCSKKMKRNRKDKCQKRNRKTKKRKSNKMAKSRRYRTVQNYTKH